jgi:hypothetical protein
MRVTTWLTRKVSGIRQTWRSVQLVKLRMLLPSRSLISEKLILVKQVIFGS